MFTDTAREDEHFETAQHRRVGCNHFANPRAEHFYCHLRLLIPAGRSGFQIAHVALACRDSYETGFAIQHMLERIGVHSLHAQQIEKDARIEIAATSRHRDSACWREAHACVHRTPVLHRCEARAVTEMRYYGSAG